MNWSSCLFILGSISFYMVALPARLEPLGLNDVDFRKPHLGEHRRMKSLVSGPPLPVKRQSQSLKV